MKPPASEAELTALAGALTAHGIESTQSQDADAPSREEVDRLRQAIADGEDPLGERLCALRSAQVRRKLGAVYTPRAIVNAMIAWAGEQDTPARIVDPGAGSGRFLLACARAFPSAELVAIETDPLAAQLLEANASALDLRERLTVHVQDYRALSLPDIAGPTLFIGNPPYIRHHDIASHWKDWLAKTAAAHGHRASRLAGLHVHFFVKTHELARTGDYGAYITSAEWLDVNYGNVLRELLTNGLGGTALHVLTPGTMPFGATATTGAITCFRVGTPHTSVRLRSVATLDRLGNLKGGRSVKRERLEKAKRWTPLLRPKKLDTHGLVELGELCRVHRGQVTGGNRVWIEGAYGGALPETVLTPAVTRARDLFNASPQLETADGLRRVIDLPADLDELEGDARGQVKRFLRWAKRINAHQSYIASHRRTWWAVGLREPAPILCTYMARRPPAFVRNLCGARHINIAHGIYPREQLAEPALDALAEWLRNNTCVSQGRTYAGGLTKFEPKEVERILVPPPKSA